MNIFQKIKSFFGKKPRLLSKETVLSSLPAEHPAMVQTLRDTEFVRRFNTEMFSRDIVFCGTKISPNVAETMFSDERLKRFIDLSDKTRRERFTELYAVAVKELDFAKINSIDGVFSADTNRDSEQKRRESGAEVFELAANGENLAEIIRQMRSTFEKITPPEYNRSDPDGVLKNYSVMKAYVETKQMLQSI